VIPPRFGDSVKVSSLINLGAAGTVILAVAFFVVTTRALPDRVTQLEVVAQTLAMVDAEKAKVDAVQDERLQNMLGLLTDIRDELRMIRQQRGR
jgi:hypothetical protein